MASPLHSPRNLPVTASFIATRNYPSQEPNIGKALASFSVIAFTLLGNMIIIIFYIRNYKMRTVTNSLVVNHCLTDTLLALSDIARFDFTHAFRVEGSAIFCSMFAFFDSSFLVASFLSMSCLALDRHMDLLRHTRFRRITKRSVAVLVSFVWLQSLLAAAPWFNFTKSGEMKNCSSSLGQFPLLLEAGSSIKALSILVKVTCVILPSVGIFYVSFRIFSSRRQGRRVDVQQQPNIRRRHFSTKHFASRKSSPAELTAVILLGTYIVCTAPFLVAVTCTIFSRESPAFAPEVIFTIYLVFRLKGFLFPIIYITRNRITFHSVKKLGSFKFCGPMSTIAYFVGDLPGKILQRNYNRQERRPHFNRGQDSVLQLKIFSRTVRVSTNDLTDLAKTKENPHETNETAI